MPNFGSFGSPALSPEDVQAIKEAIARRQQGGSMPVMDQVSGGMPGGITPPPTMTGAPPPMVGASPSSGMGMSTQTALPIPQPEITQMGGGMIQEPGMAGNFSAEKEIILGAMDNYLKHIAKMEKDAMTPTPPSPPFVM